MSQKAEYWCVTCENVRCKAAIPLLEYNPTRLADLPSTFQASCPRCRSSATYNAIELHTRLRDRIPGFQPHSAFRILGSDNSG
jgi:hypothetical protein